MAILEAEWLPGGKVELKAIPLKGDRELKELALKDSEVDSLFTQQKFLALAAGVMAAERVMKTLGVAKAKESWDDYCLVEFRGKIAEFVWGEADFEVNLGLLKARVINQQLAVGADEEAHLKIANLAKEVVAKANAFDKETVARVVQRPIISLYWRLRASGVKTILTPEGPKEIDWSLEPEKRAKAIDLLSEVVTQEQLRELDAPKSNRPLDMQEFKPLTKADVEGKSERSSTPTGSLSPGSTPSSASLLETTSE